MVRYIEEYGEDEARVDIPIPDDWELDTRSLGWEAWAHSPDGELGIMEYGRTKAEALRNLKQRMYEWLMTNNG